MPAAGLEALPPGGAPAEPKPAEAPRRSEGRPGPSSVDASEEVATRKRRRPEPDGAAYAVNDRVECRARFDGALHAGVVLHVREVAPAPLFYVHYEEQNSRLDEWVDQARILRRLPPSSTETNKASGDRLARTPSPVLVSQQHRSPSSAPGCDAQPTVDAVEPQRPALPPEHHGDGPPPPAVARPPPLPQKPGSGGGNHNHQPQVRNINSIVMGCYEVDTWYHSPYPREYQVPKLYVCERCWKYHRTREAYSDHCKTCNLWHPPGDEIYRHNEAPVLTDAQRQRLGGADAPPSERALSFFEVEGKKNPVYTQNLCLLAKLFLDHKTLYYDTATFLFYVLCEFDPAVGYRAVGYFSKEPRARYNMSCLLVLPQHQKKRYGRALIEFAYLLSRKSRLIGTPERPLSDLGHISFLSYWTKKVCEQLIAAEPAGGTNIHDLCHKTCVHREDVIEVLRTLGLVPAAPAKSKEDCPSSTAELAAAASAPSPKAGKEGKEKDDGIDNSAVLSVSDYGALRQHVATHSHALDLVPVAARLRWRSSLPPSNLR